ncbi:hypothetical protein WN944_011270 [Citrus x changshan-huyou]|uniref:Uncharacterized protein n=1 Tax=Citrus x changshan-huyou TaxID=2935761 RepID=A0AAP0MVR1_9ROSI
MLDPRLQVEHSNLCRLCCFSESETRVEVADNMGSNTIGPMEQQLKKQAPFSCLFSCLSFFSPSRAELEKVTNKTSSSADEVHVGVILDMRSRSGNISISCISMSFLMFML